MGLIIETNKGKAKLGKGFVRWDIPKTYKQVMVLYHSIGNDYNSSLITIFKVKDKSLRYEIYRDGSIVPFYGKFEFIT